MSNITASDFTDDEDSYQPKDDHSSESIEESVVESSPENSTGESYNFEKNKNKSFDPRGALNRNSNEKSFSKEDLIVSDSDISADCQTSNKGNNPHRNYSTTSSFRIPPDAQLTSESSEDDENLPTNNFSKNESKDKDFKESKLNRNQTANSIRNKLPELQSDSDEYSDDEVNRIIKPKTKKNIILSDSESESEDVNLCIQESASSEELSLHSIENDSDREVGRLTEQFNSSRISNDFDFGKNEKIINSTILDTENKPRTPRVSSKRSLNKSVDTPRILKHMKESSTPRNVSPAINLLSEQETNPLQTPRNLKDVISSRSPSPSLEILSEDDDVIDISSDEREVAANIVPPRVPKKFIKQTTLDSLVVKKTEETIKEEFKSVNVLEVSPRELQEQKEKIKKIESDLLVAKNLLKTVNLAILPDKGKLILDRHGSIERMLRSEAEKLTKMVVAKENSPLLPKVNIQNKVPLTWEEIEAKAAAVQPRTFGKMAMSTYDAQKALTLDRLQQLHGSLKGCPTEDTLAEDPKGLKVELMPHQKRALAWLKWREQQKPSGGILADDMGLGKTLTMISLMLKTNEEKGTDGQSEKENWLEKSSDKYKGGTLVVCPASLINQWSGELERRTKRGLASYEIYHGPKRETKPKRLAEHDMVITTYSIVMNECERNGAVFKVKWRRIVMDEAHQIRNHKSQTSVAVCHLAAHSRWALTGTPVHNKELDMYALLKFLRCTPFDDLQVWKRWVGDKSTGGQERLHTVISSLMLRRTKAELIEKGGLKSMPERKWELIEVRLSKPEMDVYQKILIFSRTLFAQFLHQRAEKNQNEVDLQYVNMPNPPNGPNQEYFKMREKLLHLNKVKDIKHHEILVLLLRLRQICCHPCLIAGMLHEDMEVLGDDCSEGESEALNLLDQLNNLSLGSEDEHKPNLTPPSLGDNLSAEAPGLKEAAKGFFNPSNPVFSKERASSKIKVVLGVLKEKVLPSRDKAIIVSQWPGFLRLIAYHLKEEGIMFEQLDGSVPVHKRMVMVDKFNDPDDRMKILLLSLTAGGVGLNLIGANHLFLLDLHWNPQLESQAQDRIYRVGQEKPVFVYKFLATDTIEKRILDLQEKKLDIANSMLTGSKQVIGSKLSLQDLKLLFDM